MILLFLFSLKNDKSLPKFCVKSRQSNFHQLQLLKMLSLFFQLELNVEVFDIVRAERDIILSTKRRSRSFTKVMIYFGFLCEGTFASHYHILLSEHSKPLLVILARSRYLTLSKIMRTFVKQSILNLYSLKMIPRGCFFCNFYSVVDSTSYVPGPGA